MYIALTKQCNMQSSFFHPEAQYEDSEDEEDQPIVKTKN